MSTRSATLNSTVSNNGAVTDVIFQYSTNATLSGGVTTSSVRKLYGSATNIVVNTDIYGLAAHTQYCFRAIGVNAVVTTNGDILSFTTGNTNPTAPNATASATKGNQKTVTVTFLATDAVGN